MLSRTETIVLQGLKGRKVDIEADIAPGLPYFTVIGLGDTAVKEASERVKRAVINSGFQYPRGRVTVNLSPAYIHKKGSHYDLGIAIAILLASGELSEKLQDERNGRILIGELALDGRVLAVKGALPMLITAAESGNMKEILLPEENCAEASLVAARAGINLIPVKSLKEAACHIAGGNIGSYKGSFPLR
ncbi:MAG: magnesium chelatase domain-containing protein, partial [Anaerovoracaceae bacterium]